ncbi:YbaB/EbfC family nucleoid-associated protein [Fodinicola feengrottensis]|uniref:YbaB/EbfC family nucleoid-associated protein n=1 Tax=Fodinicola feengrottensis TaxID=435914 RepID=UPI002442C724|nr:YbaB/EbfC family nucleoid-associated protein [Fodinicola feengrottensis]
MHSTAQHLASIAEIATKLRTLRDESAKLEATAESPDGLVAATVNSRGDVVELELDDRVYRTSDSAALAAAITQRPSAPPRQTSSASWLPAPTLSSPTSRKNPTSPAPGKSLSVSRSVASQSQEQSHHPSDEVRRPTHRS